MAVRQLDLQIVPYRGLDLTLYNANADGEAFQNPTGASVFYIRNNSGGDIVIRVNAYGRCNYGTVHPVDITMPNNTQRFIGGLRRYRFNNSEGNCRITYVSGTLTNVRCAAFMPVVEE